ncbi:flagellar assembly protein FliW [Halonatronum saccharophilum]|uniref:flagellar assembly protein FliW n=1 Tax=Halonatronum saccharophilum TaxID=150060 RepID=UPI000489FB10|nr:flagellar assembly protein FliW [Halonatronum saccharophilum]
MKIKTNMFGDIEIEEDKVIIFEKPILGFEEYNKFTIIDSLDDQVFYWLQSIEEPDLAFIMVNPNSFVDDYKVNLTESIQKKLSIDKVEDGILYTLVVVEDEGARIRTNLKAPIIINTKNRRAAQIVLESDYPTRHYLLDESKEKAVGVQGC